jgi:hypothetical protein
MFCGVLTIKYGLLISGNKLTIAGDRGFDYLCSLDCVGQVAFPWKFHVNCLLKDECLSVWMLAC